jgi:hypothetical protein
MQADAGVTRLFLYLNGVAVPRAIDLGVGLTLRPVMVEDRPYLPATVGSVMPAHEAGVVYLFLGQVRAEIQVDAPTTEALVARAWNSHWDVLLINAAFDRDAQINLTSEASAGELGDSSVIHVENFALRGFARESRPMVMTEEECAWIETYVEQARALLEVDAFSNSLHCLATYRWHSLPRAQLALLWAGIEGLFHIDSEIRFRLSACVARFLGDENGQVRRMLYEKVKRLYNGRSAAVHGSRLKGNPTLLVRESAALLRQLIRHCVERGALPPKDGFIP